MRRVLLLLLLLLLVWLPRQAAAFPYLAMRLVDHAYVGPAEADLTAVHYNPAALRMLSGFHLTASAGVGGFFGSYQRQDPLPMGFSAPQSPSTPCPGSAACTAAISWPTPNWFLGASWDLGSDSVTLGVAFYSPYNESTDYGPAASSPTRYHAASERSYSMWGDIGAALKLVSWLTIGAGFHFAWTRTMLDVAFDPQPGVRDDLSCATGTCEQWAQRQMLNLDVSGWGYGFSTGLLFTVLEDRLWVGMSYVSTLFSGGGAQIDLDGSPGEGSGCRGPDGLHVSYGAWLSNPGTYGLCGVARLSEGLPHLVYLGARWRIRGGSGRASPGHWELSSFTRIGIPPRTDREVQLDHGVFRGLVPDTIIVPMNSLPSFGVSGEVRQLYHRVTLGEVLMYQSPYSTAAEVSPANLDGHRVDFTITAHVKVRKGMSIAVGAGLTGVLMGGGSGSGWQTGDAAACRSSGYDVTTGACQAVQAGWALPPAAGHYSLAIVHGSAGLDFAL